MDRVVSQVLDLLAGSEEIQELLLCIDLSMVVDVRSEDSHSIMDFESVPRVGIQGIFNPPLVPPSVRLLYASLLYPRNSKSQCTPCLRLMYAFCTPFVRRGS